MSGFQNTRKTTINTNSHVSKKSIIAVINNTTIVTLNMIWNIIEAPYFELDMEQYSNS